MEDNPNIESRLRDSRAPTKIALIYLVVAGAWIFGSDRLLELLLSEATIHGITRFQTAKGVAFVLCTAGMLYLLVRRAVSQLQKYHSALAESEQRFKWIVEWLPAGIGVEVGGRITYANRALLEMLGHERDGDLLERGFVDLVHPDDRAAAVQRSQLLSQQRQAVPLIEQRLRRQDGSYLSVETAARPFELHGEPGALVIVQDITLRKQAVQALRELNQTLESRIADRTRQLQAANDDLRTFSLMISHDLQTPLRRMSQFGQELLERVELDPDVADRARRIVAGAARLERMVQDLYEYNQVVHHAAASQPLSLVLVVHDVVGQLRSEPGLADATISVREPMPTVLAHRPTLVLVLQNLISNAVRFARPGVKPIVSIAAAPNGDFVRLWIEDNGVGVDPKDIDAIWHLLDSTEESAHRGFGLAIVRRGVEHMGGRVGVESVPGSGSKFWIELRADPQTAS